MSNSNTGRGHTSPLGFIDTLVGGSIDIKQVFDNPESKAFWVKCAPYWNVVDHLVDHAEFTVADIANPYMNRVIATRSLAVSVGCRTLRVYINNPVLGDNLAKCEFNEEEVTYIIYGTGSHVIAKGGDSFTAARYAKGFDHELVIGDNTVPGDDTLKDYVLGATYILPGHVSADGALLKTILKELVMTIMGCEERLMQAILDKLMDLGTPIGDVNTFDLPKDTNKIMDLLEQYNTTGTLEETDPRGAEGVYLNITENEVVVSDSTTTNFKQYGYLDEATLSKTFQQSLQMLTPPTSLAINNGDTVIESTTIVLTLDSCEDEIKTMSINVSLKIDLNKCDPTDRYQVVTFLTRTMVLARMAFAQKLKQLFGEK